MNAAKTGAKFLHGLSGFYDAESKVGKEMYQRCKMTAIEASDKVCCRKMHWCLTHQKKRMYTIKAVMPADLSDDDTA